MSPSLMAPETPTLVLQRSKAAPKRAREFLAARFAEWGIEDDYTARLVVSELVTNAYRYGEGAIVVRVFVDEHDGHPVVEVGDDGKECPALPKENLGASTGRGLQILEGLVLDWGVRPMPEGGKVTWAKLH